MARKKEEKKIQVTESQENKEVERSGEEKLEKTGGANGERIEEKREVSE